MKADRLSAYKQQNLSLLDALSQEYDGGRHPGILSMFLNTLLLSLFRVCFTDGDNPFSSK